MFVYLSTGLLEERDEFVLPRRGATRSVGDHRRVVRLALAAVRCGGTQYVRRERSSEVSRMAVSSPAYLLPLLASVLAVLRTSTSTHTCHAHVLPFAVGARSYPPPQNMYCIMAWTSVLKGAWPL